MKGHKKSSVSLLTLLIAFVIFIQTNVLTIMIFELKGTTKEVIQVTTDDEKNQTEEISNWSLKIPKINVYANIKEGTQEEIINESIGHFTNTPYINGNIGLVAGCYGYKENYFQNLEKLEEGDIILYQYDDKTIEYKVIKNEIIDQKDWSNLNSTQENKLTLITGVINEPEKRRCVQAEENII